LKQIDLILFRHGNTFEAHEKPVWVGSTSNPPLTEQGRIQAQSAAHFLKRNAILPAAMYSGPLKRTLEFADIVARETGYPAKVQVEPSLNELDYGAWSGKTNDEISARFGKQCLEGWEQRGHWPEGCGWGSSDQVVLKETQQFVMSLSASPVVVITSNGRLRYFARLVEGVTPSKVKTGHGCHLVIADGVVTIKAWNFSPE
jgi:broad specificity phosphatase PhoE